MGRHKGFKEKDISETTLLLKSSRELFKMGTKLDKIATTTHDFLESAGRKIEIYEQIKPHGDLIAIRGDRGVGFLAFVTNGFDENSLGPSISTYNQDLSFRCNVPGEMDSISFHLPDKFYYAIPSPGGSIKVYNECWCDRRNVARTNANLQGDPICHGIYRISRETLLERIYKTFQDPQKYLTTMFPEVTKKSCMQILEDFSKKNIPIKK